MNITRPHVLEVLRNGTGQERADFVQSLPPNSFKDASLGLVGSDSPGMVVVALGPLIQKYCYGTDPKCGAVLAAAAHEYALEIWHTVPNHGLLATTLSILANCHLKALALLGRSDELLDAAAAYIPFYSQLEGHDDLQSLKVLRVEALVNLRRIDEAAEALEDESLLHHPIAGIEANRLKGWVDKYLADPRMLKGVARNTPEPPNSQSLLGVLRTAVGVALGEAERREFEKRIGELDTSNRIDVNDPAQFEKLLELLRQGEDILGGRGANTEVSVGGKIRNASAIFVHGTPQPQEIRNSLATLGSCLAWARAQQITELENDALWGIYLCHNRLESPSDAADALIQLRGNLEGLRQGISDPLKRGGIFSTYRYLFHSLCKNLQEAGRAEDLLEAIESSKGRVTADRLTEQIGDVVEDAAIYASVARLPEFARRERFHYLSYFVDEESVYAAFVSKDGTVHVIDEMAIRNTEIRDAAAHVDPKEWGRPIVAAPGVRIGNTSDRLALLVAWLDGLLADGTVEQGDHICYSSDEDFHNVPLQYLRFKAGILLDYFSVSRVHSAFHLERVLNRDAAPPKHYLGIVVPLSDDLEGDGGKTFVANLDAPIDWLETHGLNGKAIRLADATLESIESEPLDHKIAHFSTHGWFPEQERGNPYDGSYLVLADSRGLPDERRVVGGQHEGRLTPRTILEANLDLDGSHVSLMACVSGLAKEGIAGDALGLDWAFIQGGASSLISTHWKVSASAAAQFFEAFYAKWLEQGRSRAAASREAMLEMLDGDYSANSLQKWASFSLTGDFR